MGQHFFMAPSAPRTHFALCLLLPLLFFPSCLFDLTLAGCETGSANRPHGGYSPNPFEKPRDHRRAPHIGHRRREYTSHSASSSMKLMTTIPTTTRTNPTTTAKTPTHQGVETGSVLAGGTSMRERRMRAKPAMHPTDRASKTNAYSPHVAVGRHPRASSCWQARHR